MVNAQPGGGKALRPFFWYYGGKWRMTPKDYPPPWHPTIVEPFAGSAGYSLRYPDRRVILCEVDPILVGVWDYLIKVSPAEILRIPDVAPGTTTDDLDIPQEARWLVGFWLNAGVAQPSKTPSKWMREGVRRGCFWGERIRERIARQLSAIRHWKIVHAPYYECPVLDSATWFVDPPYQVAGHKYRYGSDQIDYDRLGEWCRNRPGQVIVCEQVGAMWLPFVEVGAVKTTRKGRLSREAVWVRNDGSSGVVSW